MRLKKRKPVTVHTRGTDYILWFKVSNEMFKNVSNFESIVRHQSRRMFATNRLIRNIVLEIFSEDADNFRNNLSTIRIEYKSYKKPRFIKPPTSQSFPVHHV